MSAMAPAPPGIAILMYHAVAASTTEAFRPYTVDPLLFDEHISALFDAGCRFHTVEEVPALLAEGGAADARTPVVISIDDALADEATAILARRRVPGTLFVPTGYVGDTAGWLTGDDRDRPILGWSALQELAQSGIEIAAHGHLHLAADINEPELVREDAARSRGELEDHLACAVTSYAYPFGTGRRPPAGLWVLRGSPRPARSWISPPSQATSASHCRACMSAPTPPPSCWWSW
jgi:peptidoglycan/xylan/chitin deacetylase (PgdA/CDA1 family)